MLLKYLLFLLVLVKCSNTAKILGVFWTPSKSHHIAAVPLLQALAKKGHEVHLLSSFNDKVDIPTYNQELLTGIIGAWDAHTNPNVSKISMALQFFPTQRRVADDFWKNSAVQKILKNKPKYDAVICLTFFNDHTFALANYLDAPLILFSSISSSVFGNKYVSNPNLPYSKHLFLEQSVDNFIGRLGFATINMVISTADKYILTPIQENVMRKYLPDSPRLEEIQRNVSLIFVNTHVSMEQPRPYVPNMVQIGGYHTAEVKKLPEKFQKFLDSNDAIIFSMGTNVKIATSFGHKIKILMDVFKKLAPIKILFKSEVPIASAPENVMVVGWLPQNDVLAHPNVKVFISHGGLGGTTESIYHGVPILGIPFFGDQKANIGFAVQAGFAVRLDFADLTEETFEGTLRDLLTNPKYAKNAKKRSSWFRNQPIKPMDNAIWWVEHIIEHKGGEHLSNMGVHLEWYQLYMVDIMLFYLVLIIIMTTISLFTTKWIVKKIYMKFLGCNKKNTKKIKKQ